MFQNIIFTNWQDTHARGDRVPALHGVRRGWL